MKKLMWAVLILAVIAYAVVVWGWIQEGNRHFSQPVKDRPLQCSGC
jgi:hypothetical protein